MEKIGTALVTGAAGFVGQRVVADLCAAGWLVKAIVRGLPERMRASDGAEWIPVGDLANVEPLQWVNLLAGVDVVVHLAGRAHIMADNASDPLAEYRRTNVTATVQLAEAAAKASVRKFIYMSSVKAVAERTAPDGIADDASTHPEDPYGLSKREAEVALLAPGRFGGMAVTILRPPLVYGQGVRANFARLIDWVRRGVPLPLGAVVNKRSLIYVGNLSDAVRYCAMSDLLAGKACFVTDGEDVSTAELVRRIARILGKPIWLPPVPASLLQVVFLVLGRRNQADRLFGSLCLRMHHLPEAGWRPPFTMDQGLRDTLRPIQ